MLTKASKPSCGLRFQDKRLWRKKNPDNLIIARIFEKAVENFSLLFLSVCVLGCKN